MANQIKAHPDGSVYIANGSTLYIESAVAFAQDMQTIGKSNPVAERNGFWEYNMVDGPNFSTIEENGQHGPKEERTWATAEAAISAIDELVALQAARIAAISQS